MSNNISNSFISVMHNLSKQRDEVVNLYAAVNGPDSDVEDSDYSTIINSINQAIIALGTILGTEIASGVD